MLQTMILTLGLVSVPFLHTGRALADGDYHDHHNEVDQRERVEGASGSADYIEYVHNTMHEHDGSQEGGFPMGDHDHHTHAGEEHMEGDGGDGHVDDEWLGDHEDEMEGHDHDHAAHEHGVGQSGVSKLIGWLGRFHPASVNFPVALLISAAAAEVLLMVTGRPVFGAAGAFCAWIGGISAAVAALLGWFFAGFHLTDGDWVMTAHRWVGTAVGVWGIMIVGLLVAVRRQEGRASGWRAAYRVALFVGAAGVALNGFLGGAMIYGLDHYAW